MRPARALLLAIGTACGAAGCATPAAPLYSTDTAPVALVDITGAGGRDLRAAFRAAACRRLPAEGPACDEVVLRLAGEAPEAAPADAAPAAPPEVTERELAQRFRIGFVPGLFAQCFDDYSRAFGDAQSAMEAAGFTAAYFQVPGRSSAARNADRLAAMIAGLPPDPRPFILFAHSKGLIDTLEMALRHPEALGQVAAVVGVAAAANGSPLADIQSTLYRNGVAGFPLPGCAPSDGEEIEDLQRDRRLAWWQRHRKDITVPLYSLVAAPEADSLSPLVRYSYDRLARIDPRNDGKLLWYDQIMPQSGLLGYVNADHWTIAFDAYREIDALALTFEDRVPRGILIRAATEVVAASLAGGE